MQRVQGSPDLTPSDILGISIYHQADARFIFQPGPIFSDILLFDELNRCPPRCLSALLEAMAEGQVSVDGISQQLKPHFFCLATQNPFDAVGTYTLPQSQLDRFMLRLSLGYPERERERQLLQQNGVAKEMQNIQALLSAQQQDELRQRCCNIHIDSSIQDYMVDLAQQSRQHAELATGISPRALLDWQRAAQAWALLADRDFVLPDDIQSLARPVLAHRLHPQPGSEAVSVLHDIIASTPVPR